ncbi:hypothetical protein D9758_002930 [Tetrapyrgos nigripes]|uniref:Uncharacterized protein n=1 Tax=Tetrapyrgos nigripes TaxID=182062 RepID=A0A8H5LTK5_9AGAR|nr:hypothetical protein D9758_002930 [Tetrapyrgos nigripes]
MSSSTTSSSPPPTNTNDNANPSSFFSPGSSPPLILAFLAIGLFSAAMVAVFGWRRVHFGRATSPFHLDPLGRQIDQTGRRQPFSLGDRPKLWDFWTGTPRDGVSLINQERDLGFRADKDEWQRQNKMEGKPEDVKWDNLQPLAVAVTSLDKDNERHDSATNHAHASISPNSLSTTFRQRLRHFQSQYTTYRSPIFRNRAAHDHNNHNHPTSPSQSPEPHSHPQSDPEKRNTNSPSSPSSTKLPVDTTSGPVDVQIAVAIAMPTPPRINKGKRMSVDSDLGDGEDVDGGDKLEYALGFCRVVCNRGRNCKEGKGREAG